MICEKSRIAYCKFPAEDLVYSANDMIGKQCGKRQTVFLKVLLDYYAAVHVARSIVCVSVCLYVCLTHRWGKGGNVTSAGWQVTLCDPMWHVSSRSGVATLRTAIHLLLTYLLTDDPCKNVWTNLDTVLGRGSWASVGPTNHVVMACVRWGADWRHLAIAIERSACGSDATLYQITSTTCYVLPVCLYYR